MCGRYRRTSEKQRIAEAFEVRVSLDDLTFAASDDISPGSFQPVVNVDQEGRRGIDLMYWGFKVPNRFVFNARADSLVSNGLWKDAFKEHRCIVPADAFFEWKRIAKKNNPKYEITVHGREPFALAGIWRLWKNEKEGEAVPAVAVITTDPNEAMASIHDRQPVILEPRDYEEWLAPAERPPLHLMRVLPAEQMGIRLIEARNTQLALNNE
jgi:putative SOS response-associated peptidase YedK